MAWSPDGTVHARNSERWDLRAEPEPGRRYLLLWDRLKRGFPDGADLVVIEYGGVSAARQAAIWFAGYLATVQTWAAVHGAELVTVAPNTVRKWATGRGVASKAERAANKSCEKDRMRAAAIARWPNQAELAVIDHNRVDALWTLAWGLR